ncbi:aspartate/glutamate racemase family protein [Paraphotobacterium marinum]|uniref:aspartate/glutamate racemase family protein n=1 Tax=Paraphotobacterium marinum TaxID=1755811 RepID=UPI0013145292|nr:aspartate/glutamate racemase family protein [Paraphotobacterium marinum]
MKTIGILGGMHWRDTLEYYTNINTEVVNSVGIQHSARLCIQTIDYEHLSNIIEKDSWDEAIDYLIGISKLIELGGADFLIISSDVNHKIENKIQKSIYIPVLSLVDALANNLQHINVKKVCFIGDRNLMENSYYLNQLQSKFNIKTHIIPKVLRCELFKEDLSTLEIDTILSKMVNNCLAVNVKTIITNDNLILNSIKKINSEMDIININYVHAQEAVKVAIGDEKI